MKKKKWQSAVRPLCLKAASSPFVTHFDQPKTKKPPSHRAESICETNSWCKEGTTFLGEIWSMLPQPENNC